MCTVNRFCVHLYLVGQQGVAEHDDAPEDGEELPGGRDDGARQRAKLTHTHEDEELKTIIYNSQETRIF